MAFWVHLRRFMRSFGASFSEAKCCWCSNLRFFHVWRCCKEKTYANWGLCNMCGYSKGCMGLQKGNLRELLTKSKLCNLENNPPDPCLPWPARSLIRFLEVVEIIMNIGMTMLMVIIMIMVLVKVIMMLMMLTTPWAVSSAVRTSNCRRLPPRCLVPLLSAHYGSSPLPIIHSSDNKTTVWEGDSTPI